MREAWQQLYQGQLANASAVVYTAPTAPANSLVRVRMTFCNTDTSARAVTIDFVPSGGSAGITHRIFSVLAMPASSTFTDVERILPAGASIYGLADAASKVTVTIDGAVIS